MIEPCNCPAAKFLRAIVEARRELVRLCLDDRSVDFINAQWALVDKLDESDLWLREQEEGGKK